LSFRCPRIEVPITFWSLNWDRTLELVGGFGVLGLFTRPVAFVLSELMAAAYTIFHAAQSFWPTSIAAIIGALVSCSSTSRRQVAVHGASTDGWRR
jgi:uncharacterized membrane protein YphA (DoxX/SURF4 family)